MFSITKIIFCIVLYSVSEPFISDYIEHDWTRTTLYMYSVFSICMDTFLQLDSLYSHFSVLIQLNNFQLVDRQKHYYCIWREEYYSSNTTSREAGGYAQCRDKGVPYLHQGVHGMCVEGG